jgi:hypothetical protein
MFRTNLPKSDTAMFKMKIEGLTSNPIICKWIPQSGLQVRLLHAKERGCLSTKEKVQTFTERTTGV